MVEISIDGDAGTLTLEVKGLDKLWSFKSKLEIPLRNVRGAWADPAVTQGWKGIRAPGTHIPGLVTAGTFYREDKRVFWDVHDPNRAIVIDLQDDRYDQLIVEVEDPEAAVKLICTHATAGG